MDSKLKKQVSWLVIALVIVLGFSWLAHGFNGAFNKVKVERVYFDTDKGTLSGLLYRPVGDDPRPGVVLTHGYSTRARCGTPTPLS